MKRKLLSNLPDIVYDGNNVAFSANLLSALLQGVGERCEKAKLVALSGQGNRFCWTDGAWAFGNEETSSIDQAPFASQRRVLHALGWDSCVQIPQKQALDPAQIRQTLVSSIDQGHPVLVRYIQQDDCNSDLFFGYEENGQRMVGYRKQGGAAAQEGWESNLASYLLLLNKGREANPRDTALTAFRFVVEHAKSNEEIHGRKVGLAAWASFLHHLAKDDFSSLTPSQLKDRFIIYCDALCQIDARREPLPYYRQLAGLFPQWKQALETASAAWEECASYGGFLWSRGFTFDQAGFEKFRSVEERAVLAEAGCAAMQQEEQAVKQIESILCLEEV